MDSRIAIKWSLVGQVGFFVIHLVTSMVLARLLTPTEFGYAIFLQSTVGVLQIFQNIGFGNFLIREKNLTNALANGVFWCNFAAAGLIALIVLLGADWMARYAKLPSMPWLVYLLAASPLMIACEIVPLGLMSRHLAYDKIAVVHWVRGLTTGGTAVILALFDFSFASLVIGALLGNLCALFVTLWFTRIYEWRPSLTDVDATPVLAYAKTMVPASSASQLARRVPEIALGKLQGAAALGIYGRAAGVVQMAWDNVYAAMAQVMYASISRSYRNNGRIADEYILILRLLTSTFWPCFLGLALLGPEVLEIMFGKTWTSASATLAIISAGAGLQVASALGWEIFLIHGKVKEQARREVLRAGCVASVFVLGSLHSIEMAAASKIFDGLFVLIAYMPMAASLSGIGKRKLLAIYLESSLLTLAAIGPILAMRLFELQGPLSSAGARLIGSSVCGVVCWLALIAWKRHPAWQELVKVLRERIPMTRRWLH